jgi:hypothetical protein
MANIKLSQIAASPSTPVNADTVIGTHAISTDFQFSFSQITTYIQGSLATFSTSTTAQGVVPGSNGVGTTFFLRADGSWAVPASGGSGITGGVVHGVAITNAATTIATNVVLGANQLLIGAASADPVAATISGDLTNSAGVFTIANGAVTYAKVATTAIATSAQYQSNTASKLLDTGGVWGAGALTTLTDAATVTPDFSTGFDFIWTLGAVGRTLANPTNTKVGQKGMIYLVQDATGSRTITTWGTNYKFPGGTKPTLTTTASAVDDLSYVVKSATEIHMFFSGNMS